jgi:hypothetical protein
MADIEEWCKVHLSYLALYRFHDSRPGVTGVHAPKTGSAIKHMPPIGSEIVHILRRRTFGDCF